MATLLIRDVPDEVNAALLAQAGRSRRSKEKHALFLIEGGLREQRPVKQTLAKAAKLRANCKRPVTMAEILKWTEETH
jgi:plasmid stability protein